jgi:hypothetical protein
MSYKVFVIKTEGISIENGIKVAANHLTGAHRPKFYIAGRGVPVSINPYTEDIFKQDYDS